MARRPEFELTLDDDRPHERIIHLASERRLESPIARPSRPAPELAHASVDKDAVPERMERELAALEPDRVTVATPGETRQVERLVEVSDEVRQEAEGDVPGFPEREGYREKHPTIISQP